MSLIWIFSVILLFALAADAQVIMPGRCPNAAVQEKFDAARYLGKWFEIQRLPNSFQLGHCCTATYSLESAGVVGVLNRELLANGTISEINGIAKPIFLFSHTDAPPSPYWVLSTDYDSYALVYSCTDLGVIHVDFTWILSRTPTLPEETLQELHNILWHLFKYLFKPDSHQRKAGDVIKSL
uniref:Apolipoprotein D n=1 Tax=Nothobranchius furzeri TaxID=105023 RepID=A0A8C6LE73_NOTFU